MPSVVTAYYDPILDIHHRLPTSLAMTYCFYLAPQVPEEARRLFDAAAVSSGISNERVGGVDTHRIHAIAWFLSREWGMEDLEATLRESLETHYEPTWDRARGEFTWQLGLAEEHPRGQYNAFLAAGEAVSPGAWSAVSAAPLSGPPGLVEGVDFPTVALAEARWNAGVLHLRLDPQSTEVEGTPTQFRISGLADPSRWRLEGEGSTRVNGLDLVVETTVRDHRLVLAPSR
ncbi:MAG: hypothetical protein VCC67_01965 [Myxococcota bacterium]